jgi:hypothetical protein
MAIDLDMPRIEEELEIETKTDGGSMNKVRGFSCSIPSIDTHESAPPPSQRCVRASTRYHASTVTWRHAVRPETPLGYISARRIRHGGKDGE